MQVSHLALFLQNPVLPVCCNYVCLNTRPKFPSVKPKLLDLKGLLVDPRSWICLKSRLSRLMSHAQCSPLLARNSVCFVERWNFYSPK